MQPLQRLSSEDCSMSVALKITVLQYNLYYIPHNAVLHCNNPIYQYVTIWYVHGNTIACFRFFQRLNVAIIVLDRTFSKKKCLVQFTVL